MSSVAETLSPLAIDPEKRLALDLLSHAFAEAELEGVDPACIAHAALFTAFKSFVQCYGEEPVARFAEGLPAKLRRGDFTVPGPAQ
jgi:hypothetical protein